MINDVRETIVEGGGPGGWGPRYGAEGGMGGGIGLFLLAIFLIVLFGMFRKDGHDGVEHGGWCGGATNATIGMTPEYIARINHEQAVDTGKIIHALDQQTCDIMLKEAAIIQNQTALAMDNERMFKNDKIDCLRQELAEARARNLQQETINIVNAQFCATNNHISQLEAEMPRRAPQWATSAVPASFPAVPFPFPCNNGFDNRRGDGCGCACV